MDLTTKYLGLTLKNPLVPSSSPLMESVDNIKKMEDAGVAAVVLHSLFEEQITNEALQMHYHTTQGTESFAEALTYFPEPEVYKLDGDEYVEHIAKIKKAVKIPVIGSLNGVTTGGWLKYARHMQEAGADALELNLYYISTDPHVDSVKLENAYIDVVKTVAKEVSIPIAVKLSPFFTSLPAMARRLADAGADGLVLFNRFYQPDMDIDSMAVKSKIVLSDSSALRLPLRWIAILYGQMDLSLAATGGIHTVQDMARAIMAGASATFMCSAILKNGTTYPKQVLADFKAWMEQKEYGSIDDLQGSMSHKSVAEPAAYERALYIKELKSFH